MAWIVDLSLLDKGALRVVPCCKCVPGRGWCHCVVLCCVVLRMPSSGRTGPRPVSQSHHCNAHVTADGVQRNDADLGRPEPDLAHCTVGRAVRVRFHSGSACAVVAHSRLHCVHTDQLVGTDTVGLCRSLPGLVVSLAEDGELRVSYMGTDPPTSVVHATDSKELNYDEMDEEHRRLLVTIRENQSGACGSCDGPVCGARRRRLS